MKMPFDAQFNNIDGTRTCTNCGAWVTKEDWDAHVDKHLKYICNPDLKPRAAGEAAYQTVSPQSELIANLLEENRLLTSKLDKSESLTAHLKRALSITGRLLAEMCEN